MEFNKKKKERDSTIFILTSGRLAGAVLI